MSQYKYKNYNIIIFNYVFKKRTTRKDKENFEFLDRFLLVHWKIRCVR